MVSKKPRVRLLPVFVGLLMAVLAIFPGGVLAQPPAPGSSAEDVAALRQHMLALEAEVAALKAQVERLTPNGPQPTDAPVAPPTPESESPAMPMPAQSNGDEAGAPHLQLHGYADVDWRASNLKGNTNSFFLGQFNLFITSRLTDRASFLSETVIEADHATNDFSIDLERLELIYAVNDHLNLQFGRYHSDIGYYNTAYHHSAWMQTTLGRPFLFDFEDGGGILPVHTVGLSATGTAVSRLGLHYVAELGNGRNPRNGVNPVQNVSDDNNGKSFNLGFFVRPPRLPGLQFGFSNYHDHVTPPEAAHVTENILAAHVIYQNSRFEFLNEAVLLRHSVAGQNISNTAAFYSQFSRRFGGYRPYFRYEYVNVPGQDPLYADVGLVHGPKAGLRYDLNEFAAFKVELGRTMRRGMASVNSIGTQLSLAF